jgi:cell division protein FtsB
MAPHAIGLAVVESAIAGDLSPSVFALGLMVLAQLAALLIWGAALTQRVRSLERDLEPLKTVDGRVARIEARLETLIEQLRDLNASVRWMRPAVDRNIDG